MITIKSAQFVKGVVGSDSIMQEKTPQIAFVGRSNVGKSSVINALTGVKKLSDFKFYPRTHFATELFLINEEVFFVDLPGYGYSKISLKQAEKMRKMIMWYLESGEAKPKKVVLIIDANVGPTKFDLEMMELLMENRHEVVVVANKIDKVKQSEIVKKKRAIIEKLDTENIVYFSTKTKQGKEELLEKLMA